VQFDPKYGTRLMEGYFKAYWKGVDSLVRASQPSMKAAARAQIEAGGFITKRMKANMELPARLGQCRNPMEAMQEGAQFWVECMEDYAQTSNRAMQILGVTAPRSFSRIDDWQPFAANHTPPKRERDVMSIDPRPADAAKSDGSERVAA
jgi:hypothetical protein